jgi:hypothetical protein
MEEVTSVPIDSVIPYTIEDLSVVIPHVSWHKRRIEWFLPQYVNATPPEVLKNTIVTHDGDQFSKDLLDKYGIKGMEVTPDWSTYKMMAGFNEVKTRLCVRIHNDCFFPRDDWAYELVKQFNNERTPQLIGAYHPSGIMAKEMLDRLVQFYPSYKETYNKLNFDANGRIGASFLAAYFTACQTYIFRGLYPLVMDINENKMDKEDCILALLASVNGAIITYWENMSEFAQVAGKSGEFDEGIVLPTHQVKITDENRELYGLAKFRKVN